MIFLLLSCCVAVGSFINLYFFTDTFIVSIAFISTRKEKSDKMPLFSKITIDSTFTMIQLRYCPIYTWFWSSSCGSSSARSGFRKFLSFLPKILVFCKPQVLSFRSLASYLALSSARFICYFSLINTNAWRLHPFLSTSASKWPKTTKNFLSLQQNDYLSWYLYTIQINRFPLP